MKHHAHRLAAGVVSAGLLATALTAPAASRGQDAAVPPDSPASTTTPDVPPAAFIPDPEPKLVIPAPPDVPVPPLPVEKPAKPAPTAEERRRVRVRMRVQAKILARAKAGAATAPDAPASASASASLLDAIPGGAPAGIPRFFIDSFRVPVFLLPIYQAAGIQYGVRWEVLAAINEIETDYGRNLNVSSAGAEGWMQFMPATWQTYGVDANRDGHADPYNPVDAIFAAARYLQAADAADDLGKAIFSYNHADWYVASVLHRAQLLAALPSDLVDALSGLAQGRPPVVGPAVAVGESTTRGTRRSLRLKVHDNAPVVAVTDGEVVRVGDNPRLGRYLELRDVFGNVYTYGSLQRVARRYPALRHAPTTPVPSLAPPAGAKPLTAATAGVQPAIGESASAAEDEPAPQGVTLPPLADQDPAAVPATAPGASGARIALDSGASTGPAVAAAPTSSEQIPLPGSTAAGEGTDVAVSEQPAASSAAHVASATSEPPAIPAGATPASSKPGPPSHVTTAVALTPRRPVASFTLAAAPSAGPLAAVDWSGQALRRGIAPQPAPAPSPRRHLLRSAVTSRYDRHLLGDASPTEIAYRPLRVGSRVVAGTILGQAPSATTSPAHVTFEIRPAGATAPLIDPGPIVAGWKLLQASTHGARALGPTATPTVGEVLLLGKHALQELVLGDKRIDIYPCGREDIRAGLIDRRVLATLAMLAASGLDPTVSALRCGHSELTSSGNISEHVSGNAVDISAINGVPILGNQGPGTITDTTIRRLLTLQGTMRPHQIISLMTFDGADNTLSLPDHADHIHVGFRPEGAPASLAAKSFDGVLEPSGWRRLIERLAKIGNPHVAASPSAQAITAAGPPP